MLHRYDSGGRGSSQHHAYGNSRRPGRGKDGQHMHGYSLFKETMLIDPWDRLYSSNKPNEYFPSSFKSTDAVSYGAAISIKDVYEIQGSSLKSSTDSIFSKEDNYYVDISLTSPPAESLPKPDSEISSTIIELDIDDIL